MHCSNADGQFYAFIPQDFNLDIETTGNIFGTNTGDSKLVATIVRLVSTSGTVTARRIKADDCFIQSQGIEILSSLESANLDCKAGELGFLVKKRLGVGNFGTIQSQGKIKIGSCFSNMAHLPEKQPFSDDMSLENFN